MKLDKIVSGGQTGADRAGLTVAIELNIPHGGFCPKGRRAEDGRIPEHFNLVETDSAEYPPRTEENVFHSDGTVIFTMGPLDGGSALTGRLALRLKKPYIHLDIKKIGVVEASNRLHMWVTKYGIKVLNVAGNRESKAPGIGAQVEQVLIRTLLVIGAEDATP